MKINKQIKDNYRFKNNDNKQEISNTTMNYKQP